MADIRRNVQDASPNNFVRQGVQDTSTSDILGALGQGAMRLDATLAQERLAQAADQLNAQYVVGSPAASLQTEESATDSTPLSPEDNRALSDFQGVLNTNSRARDQGRMNFDSYQLRGERLLRIAIAKRPGLAQEFRQIAAQHLGTDVLGAEVQFLKNQEEAITKAAANAANQQDKDKWKLYDDRVALLKENGYAGYAAFNGPDDPQFQQYWEQVFPSLQKKVQSGSALKMAQQNVELTKTQKEANQDAQGALWSAQAEDLLATVPGTVENARIYLKSRGLEGDPQAIRETLTTLTNGLNDKIRELQVAGANGTVSPSIFDSYMTRLDGLRRSVENVLSGASDKDLLETYNTTLTAASRASLYNDQEYLRLRTLLSDLPDSVASQITAKMEKRTTLIVSDMLQDTGNPTEQARYAGSVVQQLVQAIVPDGSSTPPDPVALNKMGDSFTKAATAFLVQPESDFRADQFTKNPVSNAAGFLQNLQNQMGTLKRVLPDDRKQELASTIAAVAGHQTRLLAAKMYASAPSLRGKVQARYSDAGGQLFGLKPGVSPDSLSALERSVLRASNNSAQLGLIRQVISGLTGLSPDKVPAFIGSAYEPGQQAAQRAAQTSSRTQGTGGQATGLRGASTRWWEQ